MSLALFSAFAAHLALAIGKQTRIDVHFEASPGAAQAAGRLGAASAAFLAAETRDFERDTQAPMVWLNLHKAQTP